MADWAGLSADERVDLSARLLRADAELQVLKDKQASGGVGGSAEFHRLKGKQEGVRLALSYLEEYGRARVR